MNQDILKGKWQEIKGGIKERWGKLTDNDLIEIQGRGEKLLGLLQKKYGYIRDKAELEYKDGVELAEIVGSIREIMTMKKDFMPFVFLARFWQPLIANKQEIQTTAEEEKYGYDTDSYFDSRSHRRSADLASQQKLGILSQRRPWIGSSDSDHTDAAGADMT
jgi:uncharacterized protein YjbJ (UPF0337 family)